MVERATIAQACQIGVETVAGTPVACNKRLGSIGFNLAPTVETNPQRPMGQKYPNLHILGKEWTTAAIDGAPVYTELPYIFSSLMSTGTVTQIMDGATPTGCYKWVFDSNAFDVDNPKTFTVEQGSAVRAARSAGLLISDTTMEFSRSEVTLSGSAIGKAISDGIVMTPTPTQLPQVPVRPTEMSFYADTTAAGLGTTKLTRAIKGSFELSSRYGPLWVVDAALPSYAATVETEPTMQGTLLQVMDTEGMANLTRLRAGTTMFFRFAAIGPSIYVGALPQTHKLYVDFAAQVSDIKEPSDEDGVYAIEWTLGGVVDSIWQKAFHIEVFTTTVAL